MHPPHKRCFIGVRVPAGLPTRPEHVAKLLRLGHVYKLVTAPPVPDIGLLNRSLELGGRHEVQLLQGAPKNRPEHVRKLLNKEGNDQRGQPPCSFGDLKV